MRFSTSSALHSTSSASTLAVLLLASLAQRASAAPGPTDAALGGLSTACAGNAISELKSSKLANCVNMIGLFQLATLSATESVVPPLKDYVRGISEEPPCDPADLASLKESMANNCKAPSDQRSPTLQVIQLLMNNYDPLRAMLQAKPANFTDKDDFCLTGMLSAAEKASGKKITRSSLEQMFSGDIQPVVQMLDKNPAIYCNNCGKTVASLAIVIAKNDTSTAGAAVNIKKTLDGKCGANFTPTDGSIPQDVTVNGAISTMASMFTLGFLLALSFVWLTVGLPSLA